MVKKEAKPRGRPRRFDEADALDRAMKVFWAKGYDGATIDDLVAGTGVVRPSLYATFGDKETLFLRCLENYRRKVIALAVQTLSDAPTIREAIRGFLKQTAQSATAPDSPTGCLIACVMPSVNCAKLRESATDGMTEGETILQERLEQAVAKGELPPDFPCAVRSRQILDTATALALRARFGATREFLLQTADEGVDLLLGPQRG